jgi:hypothetical protein
MKRTKMTHMESLNYLADKFCRPDMRNRIRIREDDEIRHLFYVSVDHAERGRGLSHKQAIYYILGICHTLGLQA